MRLPFPEWLQRKEGEQADKQMRLSVLPEVWSRDGHGEPDDDGEGGGERMTQEEAMNLSNEQAVEILKPLRDMMLDQHGCPISDAFFAIEKAVEALSAERKGEWYPENVRPKSSIFLCTNCGGKAYFPQNHHGGEKKCGYDFCPHCGARMR